MRPAVVLCMAGVYRRFREAGYTTPKFLLEVDGRTILQWIVAELGAERVWLVANRRDEAHRDAILAAVQAAGADVTARFVGDTSGQAETAAIGARDVRDAGWAGPLVFHNVDTVLVGRDLERIGAALGRADGFIDTFPSDSAAYSYVALEPAGADGLARVTRIAEKVVISSHATTGLYGFASAAAYLRHAADSGHRSGGEFYISDVYKAMLEAGAVLLADPAAPGDTIVLGTPAEYEAYVGRPR